MAHKAVGKAGSARWTALQPPAALAVIGAQPAGFARKNQRSPSRDAQPDGDAVVSPQTGPVRQEKSRTSHLPSQWSALR